jgi:hypothetical protein
MRVAVSCLLRLEKIMEFVFIGEDWAIVSIWSDDE